MSVTLAPSSFDNTWKPLAPLEPAMATKWAMAVKGNCLFIMLNSSVSCKRAQPDYLRLCPGPPPTKPPPCTELLSTSHSIASRPSEVDTAARCLHRQLSPPKVRMPRCSASWQRSQRAFASFYHTNCSRCQARRDAPRIPPSRSYPQACSNAVDPHLSRGLGLLGLVWDLL